MAEKESGRLESNLKMVGLIITIAGFLWGIWTYQDTSKKRLEQEEKEATRYAETRRIEATKPFLERQLKLYTEASLVAAALATQRDEAKEAVARQRFEELFWGELALVETKEVETAMVAFRSCMVNNCPPEVLEQRSLAIAYACRDSLAISWGVEDWRNPHRKSSPDKP